MFINKFVTSFDTTKLKQGNLITIGELVEDADYPNKKKVRRSWNGIIHSAHDFEFQYIDALEETHTIYIDQLEGSKQLSPGPHYRILGIKSEITD